MTNIKAQIEFENFLAVDVRVGTVLSAELNPKARHPAYVIQIDFGVEIGIRTSSAQLTQNYQPETLIGTQIVAVVNFGVKRIAGIQSEVLILGAISDKEGVVLLRPTLTVQNGTPIG